MSDLPFALLLTLTVLLAGYALGRGALTLLGLPANNRWDMVWGMTLGWALLGTLTLLLGLAGWLAPSPIIVLLVTLVLPGTWWLWRDMRTGRHPSPRQKGAGYRAGQWLLGITVALGLLEVLAPATSFDTLTYHFTIPRDYARDGAILYNPFFPYNSPHLIETLSTLTFLWADDVAAQLLYFAIALLFLAVVWHWTASAWDRWTALLATLFIASTPKFVFIKAAGMVEVGLTGVTLLGLWAVWNAISEDRAAESADPRRERAWLLLGGAFIGAACGVKYYGLFSALAIGLMLVADGLGRRPLSRVLTRSSWYTLGVLALGLPFYLKSWWFTGNPLYPEMYSLFGGRDWSPELVAAAKEGFANKKLAGTGLWNFLATPWAITMDGDRFTSGRTGYGALFLALLPLILVPALRSAGDKTWLARLRPGSSVTAWLTSYALIFWTLWFLLAFQRGRHLFPVITVLAILAAVGVRKVWTSNSLGTPWRLGSALAIIIAMGTQLGISVLYHRQFISVATGQQSKGDYLSEHRAFWPDFDWANRNLPEDAKVLTLVGNYQYYLKRSQFYPSAYFQGRIDWTRITDVDALRERLRELGFTHVIMFEETTPSPIPLTEHMRRMTIELRARYGEILHRAERRESASRTADLGSRSATLYVFRLRDKGK